MPNATITIRYINQPRSPKGPGSVKDTEDRYWKVWPKDVPLEQFVIEKTYDVAYETEQYQGKDQHTITSAQLRGGALPPGPGHNSNGGTTRDKQIAVLALVKPWVEKIPVGDGDALIHALNICMDAYDQTLGASANG